MIINQLLHPAAFQGSTRKIKYFEGWYFKHVSKDNKALSVIPGISYDINGSGKSFIQIIYGGNGKTYFIDYPVKSFNASTKNLNVTIEKNNFSKNGLHLDILSNDFSIKGTIIYDRLEPIPGSIFAPTIMGPYSYFPGMECNHGLISMNHKLLGSIKLNDEILNFDSGKGYIEKDWGKSFPSSWAWGQSNNFINEEASIMFSVAKIPWKKSFFTGYLCVFFLNGKIFRFTTYNKSRLNSLWLKNGLFHTEFSNDNYSLKVEGFINKSGILKAPVNGAMSRIIYESLTSEFNVKLYDKNRKIIFKDKAFNAGFEAAGKLQEIEIIK